MLYYRCHWMWCCGLMILQMIFFQFLTISWNDFLQAPHNIIKSTIWYDNQTKISDFVTECDAALKSFKLERRRSRRWCYITKRNRNFGSIPPFRRVWTLRFQCNKPYYTASSTLGTFWMGKSIKIIGIWPAYADLDIEWHSLRSFNRSSQSPILY